MRRSAGFTLLEVLTVLILFGFVLLMLSQGLRFGFAALRGQASMTVDVTELEAADRLIRRLIERADPGSEQNPAEFRGTPSTMALRSELPLAAGGEAARRIEAAIGVDKAHRLVLRWVPYLHAERPGAPVPVSTAPLVNDVERLELRYWVPPRARAPAEWTTAVAAAQPPPLISVRLVFMAGSHRYWPDIIAAPRRARPAE